jgi:hypothetical protein
VLGDEQHGKPSPSRGERDAEAYAAAPDDDDIRCHWI